MRRSFGMLALVVAGLAPIAGYSRTIALAAATSGARYPQNAYLERVTPNAH